MNGWTKLDNVTCEQVLRMGPAAAAVFLALSLHADVEGKCWPSLSRLTTLCGLHRTTIIRTVKALECAGIIEASRGGGRASTVYQIRSPHACSSTTEPLGTSPPVAVVAPGAQQQCSKCDSSSAPNATAAVAPGAPELEPLTRPIEPSSKNKRRFAAELVPIPQKLDSDKFRSAWSNWLAYRRERKLTLTERTLTAQLAKLAEWGPGDAIASIEASIINGWQGLFPRKETKSGRTHPIGPGQRYDPTVPICHDF